MRSKTSSEAHKPETKPEATLLKQIYFITTLGHWCSDQIFAIDSPQNLTLVNSIIKEESVDDHKKILKKACQKSHRNFLLLKKLQDMSDKVKKKQKHFKLIVEKFSSFHWNEF